MMPLYQRLLATNFDWQEGKLHVGDAIEFIEQNKKSEDLDTLFEVILDSFCLAIYHTLKNPNRADHFFEQTDRFSFSMKRADTIIAKLTTTQFSFLQQVCHQLALNYNTIAIEHTSKNCPTDYSMSVEYFERTVKLYQLINDQKRLAENWYNQALSLMYLQQYKDAQPLFDQANNLFVEQNEISLRSRCIYYRGVCKFKQNMFKQAYLDFTTALNYYEMPHLLERQGNFLYQQGIFFKNTKQFLIAKECFLLAEKTYQKLGNNNQKNNCRYQANRCKTISLLLSKPGVDQFTENSRLRLTLSA